MRFPHFFSLRIGLDWSALVESRSPNTKKQKGFFLFLLKKILFKNLGFFEKKEFLIFLHPFWKFLKLCGFQWIFFLDFFSSFFSSKLQRVLLKVAKYTTRPWKWPKIGIIGFFFTQRAKKASAKGQSSPQELEVGPRSGPYVYIKT